MSLTDRVVNLLSSKDPLAFQQLQASTPSQMVTVPTLYDSEQESIRRYESAQREGLNYDDGSILASVEDEETAGISERRIASEPDYTDDPEQLARDFGIG